MKNTEYLIIGSGFAGLFFAHQLIKNQKKFLIISDLHPSASQISAGIVNPVILKKFTTFWLAIEQIQELEKNIQEIESYLPGKYLINEPIHRVFHDENEKKQWIKKSKSDSLQYFLNTNFKKLDFITNLFETGIVNHSSRIDIKSFFNDYKKFLLENNNIIEESFDFQYFKPKLNSYKDIQYKKIIFCEGVKVSKNPYFNHLPIIYNKGHHITIESENLVGNTKTIKKKHFLFPLDYNKFYYGGTYDRDNTTQCIDYKAIEQLKNGIDELLNIEYHIIEQKYGFRPTVPDRRPILGAHINYKNMYILNGLGARGIINASYFSKHLFRHIEFGEILYSEVDIKRFL